MFYVSTEQLEKRNNQQQQQKKKKKNYINKMQSKQHEIGSAGSFIIEKSNQKTFIKRFERSYILSAHCCYCGVVWCECFLFAPLSRSISFLFGFRPHFSLYFFFFCLVFFVVSFIWIIIIYTFRGAPKGSHHSHTHTHSQYADGLLLLRSKSHKTLAIIISFHVSTLWRQKSYFFGYCCSHVLSLLSLAPLILFYLLCLIS